MENEKEIIEGLEVKAWELKLDGVETSSNLRAARADEKKWREQVEVYGQGQYRAKLKEVRESITALEADAKANAEEYRSVTGQINAFQRRADFVGGLKLKHSLTGAQAQKLKAKLEEGTPEKEVRVLAAKWEPKTDEARYQARLDEMTGSNTPPVETREEQTQERAHSHTAYSIAQEYGLSEEEEARLLSSLKNGSTTPGEARRNAREQYLNRSGTASSATVAAPKHSFQRTDDVAW